MGNQQLTDVELAWLGGILDGEGHLDLNRRKQLPRSDGGTWNWNRPRINIASTDIRLIARVSEIYAKIGNKFWYSLLHRQKAEWKDCLAIITIGIRNVSKVLLQILPYLTTKRDQAELLLRYCLWRQEAFASPRKADWSKGNNLVPWITTTLKDLKQDLPDIKNYSRKANTPIKLGSSETNTCDIVRQITMKIESELSGDR